ncbi:hypothetical protein AS026_35615 [Rhizobium altiplani]|uniref:Uncharacterized protein n=1 Tax=Rhizobium altiplani TaxID=1864509 RepID=A0A109JWD7_9HYPH|nr:MFS transporter [Rhizobium altiplani]KWV56250.1 hypothetical protein AS026_35615 [Rhizobium altiplani]
MEIMRLTGSVLRGNQHGGFKGLRPAQRPCWREKMECGFHRDRGRIDDPLGLLVLFAFGPSPATLVACLLLFGVGSGAFTVARATMPLVFFKKAEYAAAVSVIALPLNLTSALAAPALSGLLTVSGELIFSKPTEERMERDDRAYPED